VIRSEAPHGAHGHPGRRYLRSMKQQWAVARQPFGVSVVSDQIVNSPDTALVLVMAARLNGLPTAAEPKMLRVREHSRH
jgi:hypothetical protein